MSRKDMDDIYRQYDRIMRDRDLTIPPRDSTTRAGTGRDKKTK
jgi:hypothetical protein